MMSLIYKIICHYKALAFMYANRGRFGEFGKNSKIYSPTKIDGIGNIFIEDRVEIHKGAWLAALPQTGAIKVELIISRGTSIGHYNHIYATRSVIIEKDVLTADNVYISDNLHNYNDIAEPIIMQPIKQCKDVVIGEGSWIGEHACIIGASIGKHCVIGANAVVLHDIPDYSVAVGVPAKIIKKYNPENNLWEKVH